MQNLFSGFLFYQLFNLLFTMAKPVIVETKDEAGKFHHHLPDNIDQINGHFFCVEGNRDILFVRHYADKNLWAKFIIQERVRDPVFEVPKGTKAVVESKILLDYLMGWDNPHNLYERVYSGNYLEQIIIRMCNNTIGGLLFQDSERTRELVVYHNLMTVGCQVSVYHSNVCSGMMQREKIMQTLVDMIISPQPHAIMSVYFHELFHTIRMLAETSGYGLKFGVDEVYTCANYGNGQAVIITLLGIGRQERPTFHGDFTLQIELVDEEIQPEYEIGENHNLIFPTRPLTAVPLVGFDARNYLVELESLNKPKPPVTPVPEDLTDQLPPQ